MKIDITSFTGEVPWLDSHLLEDTQAEAAVDCRLTNGSLRAYRAPLVVNITIYTPGQQPTGWRWSMTFSRWRWRPTACNVQQYNCTFVDVIARL